MTKLRAFVTIAPKLEILLQRELHSLGIKRAVPSNVTHGEGGIELNVTRGELWKIAHMSKLSESLRIRIGPSFKARSFPKLEEGLRKQSWDLYFPLSNPTSFELPAIQVVCHKSALYHTKAVAERVQKFLSNNIYNKKTSQSRQKNETEQEVDIPRIHLRIVQDMVQVSVDACGDVLYKRTPGKHVTEAPLRETLAAALLYAAQYEPGTPLWDPFCGSAIGMTVGGSVSRPIQLGFERWKSHSPSNYQLWKQSLPSPVFPPPEKAKGFYGSDIDGNAIQAANFNLQARGYGLFAPFEKGDFATMANKIQESATIVTNLPYGHRIGEDELRKTFNRFGAMLQRHKRFNNVVVLNGHPQFMSWSGVKWDILHSFSNRGLPVQILRLRHAQESASSE